MKKAFLAAAALVLASAAPAVAQNYPLTPGLYSEVTFVNIDDGHGLDYANFLATQWKAEQEFAKAQGWIVGYQILSNVHNRPGEPDLLLIVDYKALPDAAEIAHRQQVMRDHFKMTDAQMDAGSAERSKYRHIKGGQLWQVLNIK